MTGTRLMSANERTTLSILQQHLGGILTVKETAEELAVIERLEANE